MRWIDSSEIGRRIAAGALLLSLTAVSAAGLAAFTAPVYAVVVGAMPDGTQYRQDQPAEDAGNAAGRVQAAAQGQGAELAGQNAGSDRGTQSTEARDGGAGGAQQGEAEQPPVTEAALVSASIDGSNVSVTGTISGAHSAEDGNIYLFSLAPYQDSVTGEPVASAAEGGSFSFSVPLNDGGADTKLYNGFAVAVRRGGVYREIGNRAYITNPEAVAKSRLPYQAPLTKKGLLVQLDMLNDAFELGVKHVNVNFNFAQITSGTGIDYSYEGKTYHFDAAQIAEYDRNISAYSGKSMMVTAIVLNGWNDRMPELIYPGVNQSSAAYYYGFNASTKEGFETTRALMSFLAQRYSGENSSCGRVTNWIIGNEINNGKNWNYMGEMDIDRYVKEYVRAFRVSYTAIKSASANARVFFSIDENWNDPEADNKVKYSGKHILDRVNAAIRKGGNLGWHLAYHPYPYPMTEPEFWDDHQTGAIVQNESTRIIDFENLTVLTDYLCGSDFRDPSGNVRRVILSEQGFTAISPTRGNVETAQAAAFAYAYYIADSNLYVDALILSRQVDAPSEVRTSCAFGLWACKMDVGDAIVATNKRKLWYVFKDIDKKAKTLDASEFAKAVVGISKWSDVIPGFRWKNLEK